MVKQMPSLYSLVVEHLPSKQEATGSNPVTGFFINYSDILESATTQTIKMVALFNSESLNGAIYSMFKHYNKIIAHENGVKQKPPLT